MIEIIVLTRDPKMAADIANSYILNLDRLNQEINITSTKRNRLFIEKRLEEKALKLAEAESALNAFQREHRILGYAEQAIAATAGAANIGAASIRGEIVGLEVELAAIREYATPSNPMINQLRVRIQQLRDELDRMERSQVQGIGAKPGAKTAGPSKLFPSFEEMPAFHLDFIRLTRQVKIEESVYGMLVGMLEQAKIAEVRDLPTIQVLDSAVPPERKSRPNNLFNLLVAGAGSLVLGIVLVFFFNYLETLKAQEATAVSLTQGIGSPATGYLKGNGDRTEGLPAPAKGMERLKS
jgi:uncharacterized protein involved in exopolysaccharide biosynthesis